MKLIYEFTGQKFSGVDWVFCLGSLKAKIKIPATLGSRLRRIHFQVHSGYWWNFVP